MENMDEVFSCEQPVEEQHVQDMQDEPVETEFPETETTFKQEELPAEEKKKSHKGRAGKVIKTIVCVLLILALVAGSSFATVIYMDRLWEEKTQQYYDSVNGAMANFIEEQSAQQNTSAIENAVDSENKPVTGHMTPSQVYAANVNAVVAISNQGITTNIFGQVSETASSGTGFIISKDGYIVSNYHVVSGATTLRVLTADGTEYDANLIGYDESNDLSVLKINVTDMPYVKLGSSDALKVGDQVAAIGNPLGELTSTLTVGVVSAKNRTVNTEGNSMVMLQTDAAINSGNSGGPLFNMKGEVVGITTAKYSGTSNAGATIEGIGFAIPIDDVLNMIKDLQQFGYIKSGYLGVIVQDVPASTADQYGLPMGALVSEVTAGGAAHKAGVKAKDIITHLGNVRVNSLSELTRELGTYEGGEETVVTVYRSGQSINLPIVLDSKLPPSQEENNQPQATVPENTQGESGWFNPFG